MWEALDIEPAELRRSVLLFVLTCLSTLVMYYLSYTGAQVWSDPAAWREAAIFSVSLMSILLAHEMGHYLVARYHGFRLSLPIFIPFPSAFGTLGAIIRLRSPPRNRQALLEMGAAGPIAGAVVAFALLFISLPWTKPAQDLPIGESVIIFNDPNIIKFIGWLLWGHSPDRYATYHPAAMAGWVGCLVTGINLMPVGQLDGGHVLNGVSVRLSRIFSRWGPRLLIGAGLTGVGVALVADTDVSMAPISWLVWGGLLMALGANRPVPVSDFGSLPVRTQVLALIVLVLFILTFMPVPMEIEVLQP